MDSEIVVPRDVDGEPVSPHLAHLLAGVRRQLDLDPSDREGLRGALLALLEFLTSHEGRTHANCVATDSAFMLHISEHPRYEEIPDDYGEIFFDLGGALHDTYSAPHIAANFDSTPEQLLARVRELG